MFFLLAKNNQISTLKKGQLFIQRKKKRGEGNHESCQKIFNTKCDGLNCTTSMVSICQPKP
jgi:hypothetical protein